MIQLIVEYNERTCDGSLRNGSTFVCWIVMFSVWESSFFEFPFQKHGTKLLKLLLLVSHTICYICCIPVG